MSSSKDKRFSKLLELNQLVNSLIEESITRYGNDKYAYRYMTYLLVNTLVDGDTDLTIKSIKRKIEDLCNENEKASIKE